MGRLTQILDNLIAQGKARPMLVVMPNGNVSQSAAPGEASGPMVKPSLTESRRKNGEFERSFPDIVNYVEQHYRVIKENMVVPWPDFLWVAFIRCIFLPIIRICSIT